MPCYKKLEDILKEHGITEDHLSPHVRQSYSLSSVVPYVPYPEIENGTKKKRKTSGEEKIDFFLKEKGINAEYERKLVIEDEEKVIRVLRPDFYLPDYELVIEFNGMEDKPGQKKRYHEKNVNYYRNRVRFGIVHLDEMKSGKWKAKIDRIIERETKSSQKSAQPDQHDGLYEEPRHDDLFEEPVLCREEPLSLGKMVFYGIFALIFAYSCCNPVNFPDRNRKAYQTGSIQSSYAKQHYSCVELSQEFSGRASASAGSKRSSYHD